MRNDILVVDDDAAIRRLLIAMLAAEGYTVHEASSAEEALKILRRRAIQVYLLDLQLPGMDGLELCRLIRNERPIGYVCALTGYASEYDLAACRQTGFDDYFTKPFQTEALLETVRDGFKRVARWEKRVAGEPMPAD